jgi:hypothetical protein
MKLYGLMVAQNEGDIITETLTFLRRLNVFDRIFFFDLGSEDDTLTKAEQFTDFLYEPQRLDHVYTEGLRFELLARHRPFFREGDWLAIVDADEMYDEDPTSFIEIAEREQATCISTYQAEFMLTDKDLASIDSEDSRLPISNRRKHYLIQWSEDRFFKFMPGAELLTNVRPCSRKLVNRHYQCRTPAQMQLRIRTRLANRVKARHLARRQTWPQIFSPHWKDYVMPHGVLHYDDGGQLRFGVPQEVRWKDYYSKNPFSTIFPQVAMALLTERNRTVRAPAAAFHGDATTSPERPRRRNTLLRDDYRTHVVQDFRRSVRAFQWTEATHAMIVLIRYLTRWSRKVLLPVLLYRLRGLAGLVRCEIIGLRRRLRGQTSGTIRAQPNPILRPQLSWQGVTTLTWGARAKRVEVRVGAPDGRLLSDSSPRGTFTTGPCVEDSTVFYLQDVSEERPLVKEHTLATVTVGLVHGSYVDAAT